MARKQPEIAKNQEPLFTGVQTTSEGSGGNFHTWEEIENNPALKSPYLEGDITYPAVDLELRAHHLHKALIAMGKANQREGFGLASRIEPHASEIRGRYKRSTDARVRHATSNVESFMQEAKREFWSATGFAALRASGLMPEGELDARGAQMWRDFSRRFAGPPHRPARDRYKANLKKQITKQKKLKRASP